MPRLVPITRPPEEVRARVLALLSLVPVGVDELAQRAQLEPQAVKNALLWEAERLEEVSGVLRTPEGWVLV